MRRYGADIFDAWVVRGAREGTNYSPPKDTVRIDGDIICSYQYPIGVRLTDGNFLLNSDAAPSVTTARHTRQLYVAMRRTSAYIIRVSFAALRAASIWHHRADIRLVDMEPDRFYVSRGNIIRLPGRYVFRAPGGPSGTRTFLGGVDETARDRTRTFLAELHDEVQCVAEGLESMMPDLVLEANAIGVTWLRQGEWFFVHHSGRLRSSSPAPQTLGRHWVTVARYNRHGRLCVRGTVRHPEHYMLRLPTGWWIAARNRVVASWSDMQYD